MARIVERCAGLDVHKDSVTACVRVPGAHGRRHQETQTFGTATRSPLALRDWLAGFAVTVVGMEARPRVDGRPTAAGEPGPGRVHAPGIRVGAAPVEAPEGARLADAGSRGGSRPPRGPPETRRSRHRERCCRVPGMRGCR